MAAYTFMHNWMVPHHLSQSLAHLADNAQMALFSLKGVNLASTQTVFNPDGSAIADIVSITLRPSTIGSLTTDLQFYYDSYDWTFPPDLVIQGSSMTPSLNDVGLDSTWDYKDPSNLRKVLAKLARMLQHEERQRVAEFPNERIQMEYIGVHDREELDCCLIPGIDGPTKVIFAVPFTTTYIYEGKKGEVKASAKFEFVVSSLVQNDIVRVRSNIEVLSSFEFPHFFQSISPIALEETICEYIDRVSGGVIASFEKLERSRNLKKGLMAEMVAKFRANLLEWDNVSNAYASFLFVVPKDGHKEVYQGGAVVTVRFPANFPDNYPILTITASIMPTKCSVNTPPPEVVPLHRYSPRWGAERMVEAIWEQLWDDIPRFLHKLSATTVPSTSSASLIPSHLIHDTNHRV